MPRRNPPGIPDTTTARRRGPSGLLLFPALLCMALLVFFAPHTLLAQDNDSDNDGDGSASPSASPRADDSDNDSDFGSDSDSENDSDASVSPTSSASARADDNDRDDRRRPARSPNTGGPQMNEFPLLGDGSCPPPLVKHGGACHPS